MIRRSDASHSDRVQKVVAYVYAHLDEPLDLMKLSEVANMSVFHWYRIFQSMYGELKTNIYVPLKPLAGEGF